MTERRLRSERVTRDVGRRLHLLAFVLALGALVGGATYAYLGYRTTSRPEQAVEGYFAALARDDAPAALAFGTVPSGPHDLLTSEVLAQQQRIAPLADVRILGVTRTGADATVRLSYGLHFAHGNQHVTSTLPLVRRSDGWRLRATAVVTTVRLHQARSRVALAGSGLPHGVTLLFPGAVPLRIDTPFLQVEPATGLVSFGRATTDVALELTARARAAFTSLLDTRLTACAAWPNEPVTCPLPSSRYVPGSLRGRIAVRPSKIAFRLGRDAGGMITMSAPVTFSGSYRKLDYENVVHGYTGTLSFTVEAVASTLAPLTIRFLGVT